LLMLKREQILSLTRMSPHFTSHTIAKASTNAIRLQNCDTKHQTGKKGTYL
jgi:hypothetical protein